ncbi:MAG TPA: protein-export chaperone SecB [Acidiferrobacterales bacterium]|nr:protein-export chaperone SecB [Acidiferrobacterales bacterium]
MSETEQPVFTIEKIYVKDLSVEIPNAPNIFLDRSQPDIQVQLHSASEAMDNGLYQVLVTVTVTAKLGDKTMFLVEAGQAGIFTIRNVPQQDLEPILNIACPNILFPYVRETVSDVVNRAGFPPVLLAPVNFEAIYQQRLRQQTPPPSDIQLQ